MSGLTFDLILNDRLSRALQMVEGGAVGSFKKSLGGIDGRIDKVFGAGATRKMQDFGAAIPGVGTALVGLTNPYMAAGMAAAYMGGQIVDGTKMALGFEEAMAKVNVTAKMSPPELLRLGDALRDIAKNSGVKDAQTQIPATFEAILSGVGDVEKSMAILRVATKGAEANIGTPLAVVADALVNVGNGFKSYDTSRVADILQTTKDLGKGELADFAAYIPLVANGAKKFGASLEEVGAGFALFTANGIDVSKTTVYMENLFKVLADPAKGKLFKKLGIDLYDATGGARNLGDIIGNMKGKFAGLSDQQRNAKLATLGLDTEAASAFGLMMANADQLKTFIDGTTNSTGALDKALGSSANSSRGLIQIANMWDDIKLGIGQAMLPLVGDMANALGDRIKDFAELAKTSKTFKILGAVVGLAFEGALKVAGLVADGFMAVVKAIDWVIGGVETVTTAIGNWFTLISDWVLRDPAIQALGQVFEDVYNWAAAGIGKIGEWFGALIHKWITPAADGISHIGEMLGKIGNADFAGAQAEWAKASQSFSLVGTGMPNSPAAKAMAAADSPAAKAAAKKQGASDGAGAGSGLSVGGAGGGQHSSTYNQNAPLLQINHPTFGGSKQEVDNLVNYVAEALRRVSLETSTLS